MQSAENYSKNGSGTDSPSFRVIPTDFDKVDIDDSFGLYLREAVRTPLLTAPEEIELAQKIEFGKEAFSQIRSSPHLSGTDKTELEQTVQDGEDAKKQLVESNTRLVIAMAKRYRDQGVPFMDLIQEGNLGLMRAADKFDWRRGNKFSTMATWWVRQALENALGEQGRTIQIPVTAHNEIRKMNAIRNAYLRDNGREATIEEIAEAMHVSQKKVRAMIKHSRDATSLEQMVGEERGVQLDKFIADEESIDPQETAILTLLRKDIEETLQGLTAREQRILEMRHGINSGDPHTLKEVGEKFSLSKERIRQLENNGLKKLRGSRGEGLRQYLE